MDNQEFLIAIISCFVIFVVGALIGIGYRRRL